MPFVWLYRLFPSALNAVTIIQPETIIRWHRTGFRLYWRWKSRSRGGRPKIPGEIRRLIREMSLANRLWGAPRIHGELLKLGIEVAQSTVAKYMASTGSASLLLSRSLADFIISIVGSSFWQAQGSNADPEEKRGPCD